MATCEPPHGIARPHERCTPHPASFQDGHEIGPCDVAPFHDFSLVPPGERCVLRPGEVGCFLSHRMAWERLQLRGGFVVEDDAVLAPDCFQRFAAAVVASPPCRVVLGRFGYPVGYSPDGMCPPNRPFADGLDEWAHPCYTTVMYYMDADAAKALLEASSEPHLAAPSDDFLSMGTTPGINPRDRTMRCSHVFCSTQVTDALSVLQVRACTHRREVPSSAHFP